MDMVEEFKKHHLETYKNAVIEIIKNNTNSLVDNDILSLVKTPPLDSMDIIKIKLITLAKKEKLVLNKELLDNLIDEYRMELSKKILVIKEIRNDILIEKVSDFNPQRENEVIRILKKDLDTINKKIKKEIKKIVEETTKNILLKKIDKIYIDKVDIDIINNINETFNKYMIGVYLRQITENMNIKIMVKDRTLISGIAEQSERYIFTKEKSHLFD